MVVDRFVIFDDIEERRNGLVRILEEIDAEIEVCRSPECLGIVKFERTVLLVHDGESRIRRALSELDRENNWVPLVAYSEYAETARVVDAVRAGAIDYIQLPLPAWELSRRIGQRVKRYQNEFKLHRRALSSRRRIEMLSARERQVLDRIADGGSNKSIARDLRLSPRTVEIHRANMMKRLECPSSADAIRIRIEAKFS